MTMPDTVQRSQKGSASYTFYAQPANTQALIRLCGPLDEHIRQIEIGLDVSIQRRGNHFTLRGDFASQAMEALHQLYQLAQTKELDLDDIQLCLVEQRQGNPAALSMVPVLHTQRGSLRARTPRQARYIQAIQQHDITFGIGPAGTGKTYLAVACAVDAFKQNAIDRLILVRPAVEAGEKLGFLPGDLAQKVDPYLRPLYDALYDLMGLELATRLFEKNLIEIAPLAYMRGRTLNHAFIILDEAQNTTAEQMKMFLTRIGMGSKAVITGDITQIDLDRRHKSGLIEVERILGSVRGLAFHHFQNEDVVRHPLVQRIIDAYDTDQQQQAHHEASKT